MMKAPGTQSKHLNRGMTTASLHVVALFNDGMTHHEVAEKLGIPTQRVYHTIKRARDRGIPLRNKLESIKDRRIRLTRGEKLGTVGEMLDLLDEPVLRWLVAATPRGMSIAEYISALIRDAHYDEVGNA